MYACSMPGPACVLAITGVLIQTLTRGSQDAVDVVAVIVYCLLVTASCRHISITLLDGTRVELSKRVLAQSQPAPDTKLSLMNIGSDADSGTGTHEGRGEQCSMLLIQQVGRALACHGWKRLPPCRLREQLLRVTVLSCTQECAAYSIPEMLGQYHQTAAPPAGP